MLEIRKKDSNLFKRYNTNKIILVYSGWLDSTTVMYDLLERGYEVIAMSVNYWQKHSQELNVAKQFCKDLGIKQIMLDLSWVDIFKTNGLVNEDLEIKDWQYDEDVIKSTMVLNRNMIISSYALAYAMSEKAIWIALWIHKEDEESWEIEYPDCSPSFVDSLNEISKQIDFREYEVIVPFKNESKVGVVKRGLELNVPYEKTWSCYKGQENNLHCWKCGTCIQRINAFKKNNVIDPVKYDLIKK